MSKFSVFVCSCFLAAPLIAQTPQDFVDFAAQTDMTEAHIGQLAQENGQSQAVKDYGQMLTTDHTNDYNQVSSIATKAGLNVPKAIDKKHNEMIAPLAKLKGAAFDHRFAAMMVAGHEGAITRYKKESADNQNADLKAYATQTLPVLQKHEDEAKSLTKKPAK